MKRLFRFSLFAIVCLLAVSLLVTARPYNGVNAGIAWDFGGVELKGDPGVFLCQGALTSHGYIPNPVASLLPSLVVDC